MNYPFFVRRLVTPHFSNCVRRYSSCFSQSRTQLVSANCQVARQRLRNGLSLSSSHNLVLNLARHESTSGLPGSEAITPAPDIHISKDGENLSSTDTALPDSTLTSQALDIPDPPEISALAESVSNIVLNSAGEPTFESLGLGRWTPPGLVQNCLEFLHIDAGMPWWAAILTGTIVVRLLVFPLVIKSQRNAAKLRNNGPEMQAIQLKMTEARQMGDQLMAAKYTHDLMQFMKEKDISPFKSMLVPMAMAPVFMSFFFGLRKMANLPVESMRDGGLFWFSDLTVMDPYYILPLVTSFTLWVTLEIGADGVSINSGPGSNVMKSALKILPIIVFPMTMSFPAAILCYWVSTNTISLIQVSILKIPAVRDKFGIEAIRKFDPAEIAPKKGFVASAKESWTNVKITRQLQDRERFDDMNFKRAGRGPLPKTFKYDPTKIQAKSK